MNIAFKFNIGDKVAFGMTGHKGIVTGLYVDRGCTLKIDVEYTTSNGKIKRIWLAESEAEILTP
ncbi:MAG: hypothetical protein LBR95_02265 [Azoarcus sp.]|jgi:hypothetical protein|nr:hypothetical protein [Azoarcus sp.]